MLFVCELAQCVSWCWLCAISLGYVYVFDSFSMCLILVLFCFNQAAQLRNMEVACWPIVLYVVIAFFVFFYVWFSLLYGFDCVWFRLTMFMFLFVFYVFDLGFIILYWGVSVLQYWSCTLATCSLCCNRHLLCSCSLGSTCLWFWLCFISLDYVYVFDSFSMCLIFVWFWFT